MKKSIRKIPALPLRTAEQMLENIFVSCRQAPNTVPLKTLLDYSNYRKERFSLQFTAIIVVLVLFMLLPVLFVSAKVHTTLVDRGPNTNPMYRVDIASSLPVRNIEARVNGTTQAIYENEAGYYTLEPSRNGVLTVEVTLANRQRAKDSTLIGGVDYAPPQLFRSSRNGNKVLLYFQDTISGIFAAGISAADESGESLPFQYDTATNCLTIEQNDISCYIDVPDTRGNVLHLVVSPPK